MENENKSLAIQDAPLTESAVMFQSIMAAATNPSVDAEKMTALVNLQMNMADRQNREEFNRDKIAAIMEMPSISKNGQICGKGGSVQSRYARFEDIHKVVMPILSRHNLVITFNVDHNNNMIVVQPILSHTNGHVEEGGRMALPLDTTGSKNGTQGAGSSASYGKRHSMKAMLNIIEGGEDNDGRTRGANGLTNQEKEIVSDGQQACVNGTESLKSWFGTLTAMQRAALIYKNEYQKLQTAAKAHDSTPQTEDETNQGEE